MIVFNTTYLVPKNLETVFLAWMKAEYVPAVMDTHLLGSPRLYKVLVNEDEGITYSLQFDAEGVSQMADFKKRCLPEMERMVFEKFGEALLHFSSYLKSCEL